MTQNSITVLGYAAISPGNRVIGPTIRKTEEEAIKSLLQNVSGSWGELMEMGWDVAPIEMQVSVLGEKGGVCEAGAARLSAWFGLSYATFCVVPRILMEAMPDAWQGRMADLLTEFDETFPGTGQLPTAFVSAKKDGRFVKWPTWMLQYRRPDLKKVEACRKVAVDGQ